MYKRLISILINAFLVSVVIAIGTELYVNSRIYTSLMKENVMSVLIYQFILLFLLFLVEEYFVFLDIGKSLLKIKIEYNDSSSRNRLLHVLFKTIFMYLIPVIVLIVLIIKKIPYDDKLGIRIVDSKTDVDGKV